MDFATYLTDLMDTSNVSDKELADFVGVSRQAINKWKNGAIPALDKAMKVAEFFGISLDDVYGTKVDKDALLTRIPVLGDVSAGYMEVATLLSGEYLALEVKNLKGYPREECFALRVSGDSMEPVFHDKTFVIVHQQKFCRNGDYGIFLDVTTGENVFKEFRECNDHIELVPLNDKYEKLIFNNQMINSVIVQGVVINKYDPILKRRLTNRNTVH